MTVIPDWFSGRSYGADLDSRAYSIFKELLAKTFEHLTGEERLRVLRKYVQAAAWACCCCWLTSEEMAMEQAWAICSKLMR
jgi:hypothetical protein